MNDDSIKHFPSFQAAASFARTNPGATLRPSPKGGFDVDLQTSTGKACLDPIVRKVGTRSKDGSTSAGEACPDPIVAEKKVTEKKAARYQVGLGGAETFDPRGRVDLDRLESKILSALKAKPKSKSKSEKKAAEWIAARTKAAKKKPAEKKAAWKKATWKKAAKKKAAKKKAPKVKDGSTYPGSVLPSYEATGLQKTHDQERLQDQNRQAKQNRDLERDNEGSQDSRSESKGWYFKNVPHYEHSDPSEGWVSRDYVNQRRGFRGKK